MALFQEVGDRYEQFMLDLEDKGFPAPRIAVPALAVLAVLAIAFFLVPGTSSGKEPTRSVQVVVQNAGGDPVDGATVYLVESDGTVKFNEVASKGVAFFSKVPSGKSYTVRVDAAKHKTSETTLSSAQTTASVTLESNVPVLPPVTKASFAVVDQDRQAVANAQVRLVFPGGEPERTGLTDAFGIAEISFQGVPAMANLVASASGFEDGKRTGVSASEMNSSLLAPITITLKKKDAPAQKEKGIVSISVTSQAQQPLTGIIVSLVDSSTGAVIREAPSAQGKALFENIAVGAKFNIKAADPRGAYEPAAPSEEYALTSSLLEATVALKKKALDSPNAITITVRNKKGEPVANAEMSLFFQKNNRLLAEGVLTDERGGAVLEVASGETYYATAFANGFLPAFKSGLRPGSVHEFILEELAAGNNVQATVRVLESGEPSAGARVAFFTRGGARDGFFLVGFPQLTTGPDGIASAKVPRKLDGADYQIFAVAVKGEKKGESAVLAPVKDFELAVELKPAPATVEAHVLDKPSGRPLANAFVTALGANSTQITCSTNSNGTCLLAVEADKQYAITFAAPGYADYAAAPVKFTPYSRARVEAALYPFASLTDVSLEFLGLFDSQGRKVAEVENAQEYAAKFLFTSPQADLAGFYIRAGRALTAAEDFAAITQFNPGSADALVLQGNSVSPRGCDAPSERSFDSNSGPLESKWVEAAFTQGFSGSREITLQVKVKERVAAGDKIEFGYRAFALAGTTPKLNPLDQNVLRQVSTKTSSQPPALPTREDFCGAALSKRQVPVGSRLLSCDAQNVCTRFSFYDPATGQRGASGFPAQVGSKVDLEFAIVHPHGVESLSITSPFLSVLEVTTGTNASLSGVETHQATAGNSANSISLQALLPGSPIQENILPVKSGPGQKIEGVIRTTAIKPGIKATVDLLVRSQAIDESPSRTTLFARISGTNKFSAKTSPTAMILGVEDRVTVVVKDSQGNAVPDALVSFYECAGTPLAGEETNVQGDGQRGSGRNGEYFTKIAPSGLGRIGVRVEHPDFTPVERCEISVLPGQFLKTDPETISFEGISVPKQARKLTVTSTQELESRVDAIARCSDANGALLSTTLVSVRPSSFTLKTSKEVTVELQEGAGVNTTCIVALNARSGSYSAYGEVPVTVAVQAPPAKPNLPYPAISSQATVRLDESGIAQVFFDASSLGQVTGCRLVPTGSSPVPQDFVSVSCSGEVLTVAVEYDFSSPHACIPEQGNTAKVLVSRTIGGFPVADAAIGLAILPVRGNAKTCALPVPSPSVAPTATVIPTTTVPPGHCSNGLQDASEAGIDCGGECQACSTIANCNNGLRDPGEQASDCGGVCPTACTSAQLCSNGIKDGNEEAVDCGGRCQPCGGLVYGLLPATIELKLDQFAFAEQYYSMERIAGKIEGCELRSLDTSPASPTNFVAVDQTACSQKILHITAEYTAFPNPPGLYKNLRQVLSLTIKRQGQPAEVRQVVVTAKEVEGIPNNAPRCGDGLCQLESGENVQSCAADCGPQASCSDGIRNGNEAGIDCGGSCANNCTLNSYSPLPGSVQLKLNNEAFARQTYSLSSCTPIICNIRAPYGSLNENATSGTMPPITTFVTVDPDLCLKGVAQVTADYSSFAGLYKNFRQSGTLYVVCESGAVHTRPLRVSAEEMDNVPANAPSCSDGVLNQNEERVDCGGPHCAACPATPTCSDAVKNGNETGIDCGGNCASACEADKYLPLPDVVELELDENARAEAFFNTKLVAGTVIGCGGLEQNKVTDAEQDMRLFTNVSCGHGDDILHIVADYSNFPGIYRQLEQSGSFKAFRNRPPSASATPTPTTSSLADELAQQNHSGTGTLSPKVVRVIVRASGVIGAPLEPPRNDFETLPKSINLVAFPNSQPVASNNDFGDSPSSRTFRIHFRRDPICQVEGFDPGAGGIPGLGGTGFAGNSFGSGFTPLNGFGGQGFGQFTGGAGAFGGIGAGGFGGFPQAGLNPTSFFPGGAFSGAASLNFPLGSNPACQFPNVMFAPQLCPACQGLLGVDFANPANSFGGNGFAQNPVGLGGFNGIGQPGFGGASPFNTVSQPFNGAFPSSAGDGANAVTAQKLSTISMQSSLPNLGAFNGAGSQFSSNLQPISNPLASFGPVSFGSQVNPLGFGGSGFSSLGSIGTSLPTGFSSGLGSSGFGSFGLGAGSLGGLNRFGSFSAFQPNGQFLGQGFGQPGLGGFPGSFGAGFGGQNFGQFNGLGGFGAGGLPSFGGLPGAQFSPACAPPFVCTNPQACQLAACIASPFGGLGGLGVGLGGLGGGLGGLGGFGQQGIGAGQLMPTVECTKDFLRASASGANSPAPFTQQGRIRVTSVSVNGTTNSTRFVPLTVHVIGSSGGFPFFPFQPQPLFCPNGVPGLGIPPRTMLQSKPVPTNQLNLPKEIVVEINPLTLRGTFRGSVPLNRPGEPPLPLLCDKSSIEGIRGVRVTNNEICTPDGRIEISLDFSQSAFAGEWYANPDAIHAVSFLRVALSPTGSQELSSEIPVRVVADRFRPAGIQLLFWRPNAAPTATQASALDALDTISLADVPSGTAVAPGIQTVSKEESSKRLRFPTTGPGFGPDFNQGAEDTLSTTRSSLGEDADAARIERGSELGDGIQTNALLSTTQLRLEGVAGIKPIAAGTILQFPGKVRNLNNLGAIDGTLKIDFGAKVSEVKVKAASIPNAITIQLDADGRGSRSFFWLGRSKSGGLMEAPVECELEPETDDEALAQVGDARLEMTVNGKAVIKGKKVSTASADAARIAAHIDSTEVLPIEVRDQKVANAIERGFCDQSGIGIVADYSHLIVANPGKNEVDKAVNDYQRMSAQCDKSNDKDKEQDDRCPAIEQSLADFKQCQSQYTAGVDVKTLPEGICASLKTQLSKAAINFIKQRGVLQMQIGSDQGLWSPRSVAIPVFVRGPQALYSDNELQKRQDAANKAGDFLVDVITPRITEPIQLAEKADYDDKHVVKALPGEPITVKVRPAAGDVENARELMVVFAQNGDADKLVPMTGRDLAEGKDRQLLYSDDFSKFADRTKPFEKRFWITVNGKYFIVARTKVKGVTKTIKVDLIVDNSFSIAPTEKSYFEQQGINAIITWPPGGAGNEVKVYLVPSTLNDVNGLNDKQTNGIKTVKDDKGQPHDVYLLAPVINGIATQKFKLVAKYAGTATENSKKVDVYTASDAFEVASRPGTSGKFKIRIGEFTAGVSKNKLPEVESGELTKVRVDWPKELEPASVLVKRGNTMITTIDLSMGKTEAGTTAISYTFNAPAEGEYVVDASTENNFQQASAKFKARKGAPSGNKRGQTSGPIVAATTPAGATAPAATTPTGLIKSVVVRLATDNYPAIKSGQINVIIPGEPYYVTVGYDRTKLGEEQTGKTLTLVVRGCVGGKNECLPPLNDKQNVGVNLKGQALKIETIREDGARTINVEVWSGNGPLTSALYVNHGFRGLFKLLDSYKLEVKSVKVKESDVLYKTNLPGPGEFYFITTLRPGSEFKVPQTGYGIALIRTYGLDPTTSGTLITDGTDYSKFRITKDGNTVDCVSWDGRQTDLSVKKGERANCANAPGLYAEYIGILGDEKSPSGVIARLTNK